MGLVESQLNNVIFHPPNRDMSNLESVRKKAKTFKIDTLNGEYIYLTMVYPILSNIPVKNKYIVYSYGNGSDINSMLDYAMTIANKHNVYVVLYDYIGYGYSSGTPSEANCYESLAAVMEFLLHRLQIREENILLVGQSLGTGVVVNYVAKNIYWESPIILISPYKSVGTVATDYFSAFQFCGPLISPLDKFMSLDKINQISCPVKIFHSLDDRIINVSHSIALYNSLPNKTYKPTWLINIGHNDIIYQIDYDEFL